MDQTNALQQTIFNGKDWKNSPVYPASDLPAGNTRLSISTQLVTDSIHSTEFNYSFSFSVLVSVAVYRHNRSLIMIEIEADENIPQDPHVNSNILSNIKESRDLPFVDLGFACVNSQPVPGNHSLLFLKCSIGEADYGQSVDEMPSVNLESFYYNYPLHSSAANFSVANNSIINSSLNNDTLFNKDHRKENRKCMSASANVAEYRD